jgi:hypothetical protein
MRTDAKGLFLLLQLPYGNGSTGHDANGITWSAMGNIGNAGFFMGPQMGQGIPPGYMNKIVS